MRTFNDIKVGDAIYIYDKKTVSFTKKIVKSIHKCGDRFYFTFDGVFIDNEDETIYNDAIYIIDYEMGLGVVEQYVVDFSSLRNELISRRIELMKEIEHIDKVIVASNNAETQ